jgi:hypothetical protein
MPRFVFLSISIVLLSIGILFPVFNIVIDIPNREFSFIDSVFDFTVVVFQDKDLFRPV